MGRHQQRSVRSAAAKLTLASDDELEVVAVRTSNASRATVPRPAPSSSSMTWVQQYSSIQQQLQHHQKRSKNARLISARKSTEIEQWLTSALDGTGPRFLLLGGPPGCGKSSALKSIAQQHNCSLITWQAPPCDNLSQSISTTLLADLNAFIVGSRYSALDENEHSDDDDNGNDDNDDDDGDDDDSKQKRKPQNVKKRVLMIDDLPVSATDAPRFRDELKHTMRHAAQFAPHPTVLVLSDSARGIARTSRMLLGIDFAILRTVKCITVPAVTDAVMRKRLREVAARKQVALSPAALDNVILLSNGDFRAALNSLQFSSCVSSSNSSASAWLAKGFPQVKQNVKPTAASSNSRSRNGRRKRARFTLTPPSTTDTNNTTVASLSVQNNNNNNNNDNNINSNKHPTIADVSSSSADIGADSTIGMYHAISKILNNKRDENGQSKYDVEKILAESRADSSMFIEFLHHNYPPFFGSSDDIVPVMEYVSVADTLLTWSPDDIRRSIAQDCAASFVARAFIHFNEDPVRTGWRPIHGPESRAVSDCAEQYASFAHSTVTPFTSPFVPTKRDTCDILPYLKQLRSTDVASQVTPWSSGDSGFIPGMANRADIALIDAEIVKSQVSQQTQVVDVSDMGLQSTSVVENCLGEDDIEEWDDD